MLRIGEPRNAYEVLGLPRNATSVQIRARYRQLVRSYQKELSPQQLLNDERFRRWTNSYLLLTGEQRREYDRRVRESRGREQPGDQLGQLTEPRLRLIEAEAAFVRRRLNEAAELAKEALKKEPRNAHGYALLGDILREQGKYQNALTMYNYAIQFEPNNQRYWQRLQEVTALRQGRALPRRYRREGSTAFNRPPSVWVGVGLAIIFIELSILYLQTRWGSPSLFSIPTNLIYAAVGDGFLLGLVLAATAVIGPFDEELIQYQVAAVGPETTPVGLLVGIPGIVFFWLAPIFYAVIALLDEHLSVSITIALLACALLAVSFGLLGPGESRRAVYLLGGNFVFLGFVSGWLLGSLRLRVFEH
jgi:tetratricopeptide (TPR) repeat protein